MEGVLYKWTNYLSGESLSLASGGVWSSGEAPCQPRLAVRVGGRWRSQLGLSEVRPGGEREPGGGVECAGAFLPLFPFTPRGL